MWVGLGQGWALMARHWVWPEAAACLAGALWLKSRQQWLQTAGQQRIVRAREEFEAYAALDVRIPPDGDLSALALRVCRVVKERSPFHRAAMLVRAEDGGLKIAASIGIEDQTLGALRLWGEEVVEAERNGCAGCNRGDGGLGSRVCGNSFAVVLGKGPSAPGCGRAIVTPLWTTGGRVVGALVVCADGFLSVKRSRVAGTMAALEGLAAKLGRSMENAALAERLLRAEKLAGLGLLAGGVAHGLNNPLTAVLGFADLIAHTAAETRVQADAKRIVQEARRMREMVESLANCWQSAQMDEDVEVPALLRELTGACAAKLEERGVRLLVEAGEDLPAIRGNRERLRQVMEHLLTNAAQAVGAAQKMGVESPLAEGGDGQHTIRVTVSCDERMLHLIVSDTGPGFREPARIFDPFYAAGPEEGAGMGLSFCYGIVREHGGEINAFNLHPHGAAVMVDLPVDEALANQAAGITREVA